jgi:branched-subunit amino acid ABC-type transport system permease component
MSQAALAPIAVAATAPPATARGRRAGFEVEPLLPLTLPTRMQKFRGYAALTGFVTLIALGIPVQWVMLKTRIGRKVLPFRFHRMMARVLGMDIIAVPSSLRPSLEAFIQSGGKFLGQPEGVDAPPSVVDGMRR